MARRAGFNRRSLAAHLLHPLPTITSVDLMMATT